MWPVKCIESQNGKLHQKIFNDCITVGNTGQFTSLDLTRMAQHPPNLALDKRNTLSQLGAEKRQQSSVRTMLLKKFNEFCIKHKAFHDLPHCSPQTSY